MFLSWKAARCVCWPPSELIGATPEGLGGKGNQDKRAAAYAACYVMSNKVLYLWTGSLLSSASSHEAIRLQVG